MKFGSDHTTYQSHKEAQNDNEVPVPGRRLTQHLINQSIDVNACSVEETDAVVFLVAQQQRQLCPTEYQSFDSISRLHLRGNCEKTRSRFGQKNVLQQFAKILVVYVPCSSSFGVTS